MRQTQLFKITFYIFSFWFMSREDYQGASTACSRPRFPGSRANVTTIIQASFQRNVAWPTKEVSVTILALATSQKTDIQRANLCSWQLSGRSLE